MKGQYPIPDERDLYSNIDSLSHFQTDCQKKKHQFLSLIDPTLLLFLLFGSYSELAA